MGPGFLKSYGRALNKKHPGQVSSKLAFLKEEVRSIENPWPLWMGPVSFQWNSPLDNTTCEILNIKALGNVIVKMF